MGVYSAAAAEQHELKSMTESFKFSDLLEFAIESERNNRRMFNTLIELDFHEAVQLRNADGYLTEAQEEENEKKEDTKTNSILDKIVEALKKFGDMIATAFKKIRLKFLDLIGANKRLVKKIGKLSKPALEKALGEKDGPLSDVKFTAYVGTMDEWGDKLDKISREKETVVANIDKYTGDAGDLNKELEIGDAVKDTRKQDVLLSDEKVKSLFKEMPAKEYIDTVKIEELDKKIVGGYEKELGIIGHSIDYAKKQNDKDIATVKKQRNMKKYGQGEAARANAKYRYFNAVNSLYCKMLNQAINIAVKAATYDRAAYAKLGTVQEKYKLSEEEQRKADGFGGNVGRKVNSDQREEISWKKEWENLPTKTITDERGSQKTVHVDRSGKPISWGEYKNMKMMDSVNASYVFDSDDIVIEFAAIDFANEDFMASLFA